ncbi:MAG: tail fiber domain-containing protein [Pyrinomonadaceae bacterium]
MRNIHRKFICLTFITLLICLNIFGQTSEFTFQGSLKSGGAPAEGNYDFEFALFDALTNGAQIGSVIPVSNVPVADGIFSVKLDFAGHFPGADRFLEIRVRPTGGGAYSVLSPRQTITSAPYSIKSLNSENAVSAVSATTAENALQLGGIAANQFILTTDARLSDARPPLPNSPSYIQNGTVQQASGNFNISGDGTVAGALSGGTVNATSQFNLGGNRILTATGTNLFAGIDAGASNPTGNNNSFFGRGAGQATTTGAFNSLFGLSAGRSNIGGTANSFFGARAGEFTTGGGENSFFGADAGRPNTSGAENSFFGTSAGGLNTTGSFNSFFGRRSGQINTTGNNNTFFGILAGSSNTTGSNNTAVGSNANVGSGNLSFATAIGAGAIASANNTIQLGRADGSDEVRISGKLNLTGLGSAGSTALCRNASNEISVCSSSIRYKTNVRPFAPGLRLIRRLRPVSFDWREQGTPDLGLVAEEVAGIEPLLTTRNERGEAEGVKYDRIGVVLINAVNEQQVQIEDLEEQNRSLQKQLDEQKDTVKHQEERLQKQESEIRALKALVCDQNKEARICSE